MLLGTRPDGPTDKGSLERCAVMGKLMELTRFPLCWRIQCGEYDGEMFASPSLSKTEVLNLIERNLRESA